MKPTKSFIALCIAAVIPMAMSCGTPAPTTTNAPPAANKNAAAPAANANKNASAAKPANLNTNAKPAAAASTAVKPPTTTAATAPPPPATPAPTKAANPKAKTAPPPPADYVTLQNKEYLWQVKVPGNWQAGKSNDGGVDLFMAGAPDDSMFMFVMTFEDKEIPVETILKNVINSMGFQAKGEYTKTDDEYVEAAGTGKMEGKDVYWEMFVWYVPDYDLNYVVYIVTPEDKVDANEKTLDTIMYSFEAIEG